MLREADKTSVESETYIKTLQNENDTLQTQMQTMSKELEEFKTTAKKSNIMKERNMESLLQGFSLLAFGEQKIASTMDHCLSNELMQLVTNEDVNYGDTRACTEVGLLIRLAPIVFGSHPASRLQWKSRKSSAVEYWAGAHTGI